jgi:hypothetical protein
MSKTSKPSVLNKYPRYLLQTGLAFVFIYAALASFARPNDWIGYFPSFLRDLLPSSIVLTIFSTFELLLAGWLLSNWKLRWAAAVTTLALLAITLTNLSIFDVTFRDVGLALSALALFFLAKDS